MSCLDAGLGHLSGHATATALKFRKWISLRFQVKAPAVRSLCSKLSCETHIQKIIVEIGQVDICIRFITVYFQIDNFTICLLFLSNFPSPSPIQTREYNIELTLKICLGSEKKLIFFYLTSTDFHPGFGFYLLTIQCLRDHPFKTSACGGRGVPMCRWSKGHST